MKRTLALALVATALAAVPVQAQTRRGAAPRGQAAAKVAAARKVATDRVAGQITTVAKFLYLYGGIAKAIQTSETTAAGAKLPPDTQALLDKNKTGVVEGIRNLGDDLRRMEMDFSEDPNLKDIYQQVNGLSDDVSLAADVAATGKYDDAGQRLVTVIDTLARALLPPAK